MDKAEAIAAHSPADIICGAFDAKVFRDSGDPGWQAWDPAERAWSWHGQSDKLLPTTPIEIQRYNGPIFLSHGIEDKVWSVEMTRRLEKRLRRRQGHTEVHFYEGEGHGFSCELENAHNEKLLKFFNRFLK